MKHSNDPWCASCQEKLRSAHPDICLWFFDVVRPRFPEAHISWAWRGEADQNAARNSGKSALAWPYSKHNKTGIDGRPKSEALDLFEQDDAGHGSWHIEFYEDVWEHTKQSEFKDKIAWGGNFKKRDDSDHFELKS